MPNKMPVSRSEYEIIRRAAVKNFRKGTLSEAERILGIPRSTLESVFRLLADRGLVSISEEEQKKYVLTDKGREALENGLPEEKLLCLLEEGENADLKTVKEKLGREAGIAIGMLRRKGYVSIKNGRILLETPINIIKNDINKIKRVLNNISREGKISGEDKDVLKEILKRGLAREVKTKVETVEFKYDPKQLLEKVAVEASTLTHKMLKTGEWRKVRLRAYDVTAEPPRILPARKHFLRDFIDMLKDIMKELGFVEVSGPMIEAELYNFDLLFQPQDHPAREIHDTLWVKKPARAEDLPKHLLERAAKVHGKGWGYKWNPEIAARLVLRSQTTSVSARILASKPSPPLRVFTVGRVFRSDVVDATHLPEFHQLDGLDGRPGYTFRDLLSLLREISGRLGFRVKFKPGYFPFTEPSVEGYVQLPNGKWLELFGAGLMRPEVLEMAGIDYPVGAWGFGVERLAAAYYGITDIRMLYTSNTGFIRSFKML